MDVRAYEPSLADELVAARAHLTRRIEALALKDEAPSFGAGRDDSRALIAELSAVLLEIELRLSELSPEERMTEPPPVI